MSEEYYQPLMRPQIGDPTTTRDGFICTMESGAMGLDYHTLGEVQLWGGTLEQHQSDHVGGTDLDDLHDAWAWAGYELDRRSGQGWAGVKAALAEGRAVMLQGDYDQMGPYSCQAGFAGDHCIELNPSTVAWAKTFDPLCKGAKIIPEAVIRAYAEKLNPRVQFAVSAPHDPKEADMFHAKPGGKALGTVTINGAGHYLLSSTDPAHVRFGPRPAGEVLTVIASLNLVDANGHPIDIDGHQPPLNARDHVYLVDKADFGADPFILRADCTPLVVSDDVARIATIKSKVAALAADVADD
jgi:hypothetical protein